MGLDYYTQPRIIVWVLCPGTVHYMPMRNKWNMWKSGKHGEKWKTC